MMFNFVFDKRSLVMLVAGLTVAGGLLFFAGLLVGVNLGLPGLRGEIAYAPRPLPAREPVRPCPEPVMPAEARPAPVPVPFPEPPVQTAPPPAPLPLPQVAEEEPQAPPPTREQPRAVQASLRQQSREGVFSVQVGAFRVKQNSDAVIEQLKSRGYEPFVETAGSLHIVRIGRYAEREEALRIAAALKSEKMEAVVRQVKQL